MACLPLTHKWITTERVGKVRHQLCVKCSKSRVRVK